MGPAAGRTQLDYLCERYHISILYPTKHVPSPGGHEIRGLVMAIGKSGVGALETSDVEMIEHHRGEDDAKIVYSDGYGPQGLRTGRKTKAERTLLLKADMCIAPLAALCYLVSYLVSLALPAAFLR